MSTLTPAEITLARTSLQNLPSFSIPSESSTMWSSPSTVPRIGNSAALLKIPSPMLVMPPALSPRTWARALLRLAPDIVDSRASRVASSSGSLSLPLKLTTPSLSSELAAST